MEALHERHLISSLLHLLQKLILYLCLFLQTFLFLSQHSTSYYLFPIAFILLQPIIKLLYSLCRHDVYLLDYSCLRPPANFRVPTASLLEHLTLINCFDAQSIAFMSKVIVSSGMGEETSFPPSLHFIPPQTAHANCLDEARTLFFPTIDDLFNKTRILPRDVDVLVINCSGFCPVPSLAAMIIHHYAMRDDVKSYNLSGMGCSAGAVGIDVARGALRSSSARYALLVSTEIVSTGWYAGKDRRKLLLNCLFRMGCAAVLLTDRRELKSRAKYKLIQLLRTSRAFNDRAYRSASREEDTEGITGFSIERDLLQVAAETLRANAFELGKTILPAHQKLRYVMVCLWRAWKKGEKDAVGVNWRNEIHHFCLPSSGRAVMEEIGKGLGIGKMETEAARMTFHRFGNQSSASMWYQLAYQEAKGRVGEGERVWQLAMGSGPKCNSLVWECLNRPEGEAEKGPWASSIHRYPVDGGSLNSAPTS